MVGRNILTEKKRHEELVQYLSRYDAFMLTLEVLGSLKGDAKGYLDERELRNVEEYLPLVEPLFSTIGNLKERKCKIERAKNLIEAVQNAMAYHVNTIINGSYARILTMGLPTVLEIALRGAENVEVCCIHPTYEGREIAGFVERCESFFRHTKAEIVHLGQCKHHIDWADAIFLDTFGAWFSAFVREGTDMLTSLAYKRKPVFLLMGERFQWSDRDLYGVPMAPDNFEFLVTEKGLHTYKTTENPLVKRWTFSKA